MEIIATRNPDTPFLTIAHYTRITDPSRFNGVF